VRLQDVLLTLIVAGLELALVAAAFRALDAAAARVLERMVAGRSDALAASSRALRIRVRSVLIVTGSLLAVVILTYNGWLAARHVDAWAHTVSLLELIGVDAWIRFGIALAKLAAAALGFLIVVRLVRRVLRSVENALTRWGVRVTSPSRTMAAIRTHRLEACVRVRLDFEKVKSAGLTLD